MRLPRMNQLPPPRAEPVPAWSLRTDRFICCFWRFDRFANFRDERLHSNPFCDKVRPRLIHCLKQAPSGIIDPRYLAEIDFETLAGNRRGTPGVFGKCNLCAFESARENHASDGSARVNCYSQHRGVRILALKGKCEARSLNPYPLKTDELNT